MKKELPALLDPKWGAIPRELDTRRGRELVRWIAYNDNPGDRDPVHVLAGYLTVVMLAHVYGASPTAIAEAVEKLREEEPGASMYPRLRVRE